MRSTVRPRPAAGTTTAPRQRSSLWSWLLPAAALAVVALAIMGGFLWIYPAKRFTVPIGWDQSEYLWRTKLAQLLGVANIDKYTEALRSTKAGRPAFPVIAATLSGLGHINLFRLAAVLPSILAAAIGLAAGGLVTGVLRRPLWQLGAVAIAVGFSPVVVRLMNPEAYMDNMFSAAVFLAAAVPVALSLEAPAALIPAVVLLGAGATIHWAFFFVMAAILLFVAVLYLPTSWQEWRGRGRSMGATSSARIVEAVVGGAAVGAAVIFAVMRNGIPKARLDASELTKKLRIDLQKYRFPITLPMAGLGLAALGVDSVRKDEKGRRSRFLLAFMVAWCLAVLAGYVARILVSKSIPSHRFLAFALSVPVLGAIGLLWIAELVSKTRVLGSAARVVGALVVVVGLFGTAYLAHRQWFGAQTWTDPGKLEQAGTAGGYLEAAHVPVDRPVVFIMHTGDYNLAAIGRQEVRAALPADRITHAYFYIGTPEHYLARQPEHSRISRLYFNRMSGVYASNPVAIILPAFAAADYEAWVQAHPGSAYASKMAVVHGPHPPAGTLPYTGPPLSPMSFTYVMAVGVVGLAILTLVGLGWMVALLGRWLGTAEVLALAPAMGVAVLVLGGILIDQTGIRLAGLGAAMTPVIVALAGWAVAGLRSGWFARLRPARAG
jgi:hypothetical protein